MAVARAGVISSVRNPFLQEIRRALRRGELTDQGLCAVEGLHLLQEALRSRVRIEATLGGEPVDGVSHYEVPERVLSAIASTKTSPGVISLVRLPVREADELKAQPALIVLLDGLQDPGNAGTILRSAEAFGATGAVFLPGSVSPYNAKLMRASAGSIFRVPFLTESVEFDIPVYAAEPHGGIPAPEVDWTRPCALIIGSEAHGVSPELAVRATPVQIPTTGVESLNAAVSASILLYEAARQRRAP